MLYITSGFPFYYCKNPSICSSVNHQNRESNQVILQKQILALQTGGKSDDPCQGWVLIDDGCSTNEGTSCGYGSCSKVPLRGIVMETYRNDLLCCQNLHVATSIRKSCLSLLSLSLCCEPMPHLGNNNQWNNQGESSCSMVVLWVASQCVLLGKMDNM